MKRKQDKGFTLIEVMVALAIVAIVSTPLFRMFVTTSYANHEARVMDWANTIVVQQAELFKADPKGYKTLNGNISYYFYKGDGNFIEVYPDLSVIPGGAALMVKSTLPDPVDIPSKVPQAGYYPDFAARIDLKEYSSNIDVSVSDLYVMKVEPSASTLTVDSTKITHVAIPIRVDFTQGDKSTINVKNYSDKEVEFYIFNTASDSDVTINTVEGAASKAFIKTPVTDPNKGYLLTLTVSRLKDGVWTEMLNYSASANDYLAN